MQVQLVVERHAVLTGNVVGPGVAQIALGADDHPVGGVPEVGDTRAAFDVAASDIDGRIGGGRHAARAEVVDEVRASGDRVVAVDVQRTVARGRTGTEEQGRRSGLPGGMVVREHEVRVDIQHRVDLVVREGTARVARVGALHRVDRPVVVIHVGRAGERNDRAAGLHVVVAVGARTGEREEQALVGRTGATQAVIVRAALRVEGARLLVGRNRAGRIVELALQHALGALVADIGRDVALAVCRVGAQNQGRIDRLAAAEARRGKLVAGRAVQAIEIAIAVLVLIDAPGAVEFDALEVLAHDEVHNARESVRTVGRRSAAGLNFHMVDQCGRDLVHVRNRNDRIARRHALAVDQDQGALRAEIAKVNGRRARRGIAREVRLTGIDGRQIVQQRADIGRAFELQFLLANGRHRRTGIEALLRNARTRHDDGFDAAGLVLRQVRSVRARLLKRLPEGAQTASCGHFDWIGTRGTPLVLS